MYKNYVVKIIMTACCVAMAHSVAIASEKTRLVFLGNKNIAPVVYLDNATPAGVAVDIVRALAQHMPQPIDIKAMDWVEAQALVAKGEADALIQINQTEERKKIYDFSEPLLESQFSIFTSTGRVGISGLSSLSGLRVGVESGGLPRQLLEKNPLIPLTIIPTFLDGFKLLNEGAIDAVVVDYRVGSYIIAENRLRNITVTGEPVAFSYSAIAVKRGNTRLLAAINDGLRIIKADGTYEKIIDKWKPKEVVFKTREQITQWRYYATVVGLLILILIAVVWMLTLKSELTKRKAAEERLKGEEARYRALFEDSPISLWEEDFSAVKRYIDDLRASGVSDFRAYFDGHPEAVARCADATRVVAVNQATLKLFRADSKEHLLAGLNGIFSEESFAVFKEELIALAAGCTQFQSESVQKNLHGDKFNNVVRLSLAPGYERNWEKVFVSVSDITDRKRIEDDLRTSEENYRRLLDTIQEGIWVIDTEAVTTFVNPRMAEILGYLPEEMIGKHLFSFMDEQGKLIAERNIDRRRQGIKEQHDFEFIRKSGERIYTRLETGPIFDAAGEYAGSIAAVADITERRQADLRLHASEQLFRSLAENSPDVIVRYDRDGRRIYVNPEFERVNHLSAQEVLGKKPAELSTELAPMADVFTERLMAAMASGTVTKIDLSWTKEGRPVCWFVRVVPEFDADGSVVSALTIWSDITERKRAEEDIRKLNEDLELRVKQRTSELETINAELGKMNRVFVGRELRMIELKERIRELEGKALSQ